jgi:hypothetical protein
LSVCIFKVVLLATLVALISAVPASAQQSKQPAADNTIAELVASCDQHFKRGESCFSSGNMECARREFDIAVDVIVNAGTDIRSNPSLLIRWRQLIEQIDNYQTSATGNLLANNWKTQEFLGQPVADTPGSDVLAEDEGPGGPLSIQAFQQKFEELKTLFRTKYSRDLVITGADHEEHRRLYGSGSAYDIRVRDLSAEQIAFVIATGERLGLHVKDFSTSAKVAMHNARVASLGLPSDTLASSVHIHIDRNTPYRTKGYVTEPASKKLSPAGADSTK